MEPARAHDALQIQAFTEKMAELGKVLFVSSILKSPNQVRPAAKYFLPVEMT